MTTVRRRVCATLPRLALLLSTAALANAGCATLPPAPDVPIVTWEQKVAWMMRLEDQRLLRDPNPPPVVVLRAATPRQPAIVAPPPPSDLVRLFADDQARVRRRAALAAGRVGLVEAVEPLSRLLQDQDAEVRQMAAFALGLLGDASARPVLTAALTDADAAVQGRAAEALGTIANREDAAAVSAMVQAHVRNGALAGLQPDDLQFPLSPQVEAVRLGVYALVRLASYDALAAAVLNAEGQPVSRWWPVAYALQRINDPRAAPALQTLLDTPGRYTAAFAARGLGTTKAASAAAALRGLVDRPQGDQAITVQAIRALASIGDRTALPVLIKLVADIGGDVLLRGEAMTAVVTLAGAEEVDLFLDLLSDPLPAVRSGAIKALARLNQETFLGVLAGLDADRDWTVRASQAEVFATLPAELAMPRLTAMLADQDQRVVPAVLAAIAKVKPADVDRLLIERLKTDDFAIRAAAADALAELGVRSAAPALVEAYRASLGDSTYAARTAIVTSLHKLDPAAARPLLQEALRDRDWAARVAAAALLRQEAATEPLAAAIRPAPQPSPAVTESEWAALASPQFSPRAFIETDKGTIELELAVLDAPLTVRNFIGLARRGFFDGIAIHRVVPDFVVQDGDPRGDGQGGPGYTIRDEINQRPYLRGTVGMALAGKDTGGSQFFITHSPQPHLDGRYTVFGSVVNGMEVVDRVAPRDVIRRVRIWDGVTPQ